MSINLLEHLQQQLGYPQLKKIDPNTQEVVADTEPLRKERLGQAGIPSIIMALYNYSTKDEGASAILANSFASGWVKELFGTHSDDAINKIAGYANLSASDVSSNVENIADQAVIEVRQAIPKEGTLLDVKKLLADQRNTVLPYLPATLQMGEILNNPTFDDRTNKMEGPVSNLIHAIGNIFSSSDADEPKVDNNKF